MKKYALLSLLVAVITLQIACSPEQIERSTPPTYTPDVEMCQVHMTFDASYVEGEGYVWDIVFIKNGMDESAKVLITYEDDEAVALEKTLGHLSEREYDIFINKGSSVIIRVQFQDPSNNWVDCPGSPAHLDL